MTPRGSCAVHALPPGRGALLCCALLAGLGACQEDELGWVQFNAAGDSVTVQVGVDELLDPVSTVLHSSSGQVEVGTASVDPGGGPVGTEHLVVLEVYDDWEDQVGRATVRTDSGERGVDEYELRPDSADEGLYTLTLVSVGEQGEQREDTFTFRLWEASDTAEPADTGS